MNTGNIKLEANSASIQLSIIHVDNQSCNNLWWDTVWRNYERKCGPF